MSRPPQYFRAGVGAVIVDSRGLVLALERSDVAGAWQLPQGGMEADEEPPEAVLREIAEETGIAAADLREIARYPEPLAYELPPEARRRKTGRGQVQYWFLFRYTGDDTGIRLPADGEFARWSWIPFRRLAAGVVGFRQRVYDHLAAGFREHLAEDGPAVPE